MSIVFLVTGALCVLAGPPPVQHVVMPSSTPQAAAARRFDLPSPLNLHLDRARISDVLHEIAAQTKRAVLMDDEAVAKVARLDLDGRTDEVLDRIGETYGYTWTLGKSGAILLRRAFRTADQVPQFRPEDARQVASDIMKTIDAVGGGDTREMGGLLRGLISSLSPDQQQLMRQRGKLLMADLTTSQQRVIYRTLAQSVLGSAYNQWRPVQAWLEALNTVEVFAFRKSPALPDGSIDPMHLAVRWREADGSHTLGLHWVFHGF